MGHRKKRKTLSEDILKLPVPEKSLEGIVRFDQMEVTRKELGLQHNEIYCGYLRQPITEHRDHGYVIIIGYCSYANRFCARIPENDYFDMKCKYRDDVPK